MVEHKKAPNLRFQGFTDDWEQRKLNEVTRQIKSYSLTRKSETKKETNFKYIHYGDIHTGVAKIINNPESLPSITVGNYIPLKSDDIIVADTSEDYKGIADACILTNTSKYTVIAGLHTIALRPNVNIVFPLFLYYVFENANFKHFGYKTGTGLKVFGISSSNLQKYKYFYPSIAEQIKISKLIYKIESTIALHQHKIALLKQLKKGLLQKMFADKKQQQPTLRFKGFIGGWEQRKLDEEKDVRDGTHSSPKYHTKGFPLVTSKNLKPNGLDLSNISLISKKDFEEINKRSKVDVGDILFGMIGTIGNPIIVKKTGFAIKNVALIKDNNTSSNSFLLQLLKSPIFSHYIYQKNAGGTQKFLGLSVIRNFTFLVPKLNEQVKIANLFNSLDETITLHQNKLNKLKQLKQGLLQQMFI